MAASDSFYLEIQAEVNTVLEELGTEYSVRGHGTYNPDTLETLPAAPRTVVGLVADQKDINPLGAILFPVGEGSAGWVNKKALILSAGAVPDAGEEVLVDGQWFPLSKVVPIKPAEITVVYMLDVTR